MSTTPSDQTKAEDELEATSAHDADRAPTADEERAAEQAAADVDLDDVTAHEQEMGELGANVKGEGEVTPS